MRSTHRLSLSTKVGKGETNATVQSLSQRIFRNRSSWILLIPLHGRLHAVLHVVPDSSWLLKLATSREIPETTLLYQVVAEQLETFLASQQERDRPVPKFEREFRSCLGFRSSQCGAVTFVQRYGDALNATHISIAS